MALDIDEEQLDINRGLSMSNSRVKRQQLLPPASFLDGLMDDEYSRNARSAAKRPGLMIYQRGMYCQTQYSLQILNNGRVNGTRHHSDKYTILNFIPIGVGKVYIQGVATDRYLCMGMDGRLYGSKTVSDECILVEKFDHQRIHSTYSSYKYSSARRRWYVALSKLGKARRGNKSRKRQKSIRFITYLPNYDRTRFSNFKTTKKPNIDHNDVRMRRAKDRRRTRKRLKSS
ncbi:Fibroblast growth factor 20 [Chamberlinius hualienensis]